MIYIRNLNKIRKDIQQLKDKSIIKHNQRTKKEYYIKLILINRWLLIHIKEYNRPMTNDEKLILFDELINNNDEFKLWIETQ